MQVKEISMKCVWLQREGHRDLVEYFICKGVDDWNGGMFYVVEGGHQDLIDFFISKGANNWNWAMQGATEGGHRDLVDFFKTKMQTRQ